MRHKAQLLELMLVDTAFAEVLGKLAQEVFLGKVRTLKGFLSLHQQSTLINNYTDAFYYQFKFEAWLKQLFFPANELAQHQNSKSNFVAQQEHVYVFKNDADELVYCSHFDRKKLFEMLINTLQLPIDLKKSKLAKDQVTLFLNLEMH